MHGRVKVRTSEEEKIRKEKERQAKLKVYKNVTSKINTKRSSGELDKEMLELTGQLLGANPDIYTLWNIRREVLQLMRKQIEDQDELSKVYDAELHLTEFCLKSNPKSYSAWFQREWVLTTRPDPDWKKELALCNLYLKLDERNFHTWDYRRFVVGQYKTPLEDEFKFTTEKIHDNFSNYSAWHYRSKMLVALYPDNEGGRPIADKQHKEELELVVSAAFTDPDDTSAWFYQRWLLGAVKKTSQLVVATIATNKIVAAFNSCVSHSHVATKNHVYFNDKEVDGSWTSSSGKEFDNLWIFKHTEDVFERMNIKIEYEQEGDKQTLNCMEVSESTYLGRIKPDFRNQYSTPVLEELQKQLDSCQQLLKLEPDSKFTLLTTTVLLHCIDPITNHAESMRNLQKLKKIDSLRSGYYDDLITKWSIEQYLTSDASGNRDFIAKNIFDFKLTWLPNFQYLSHCRVVDLSCQSLTSEVLPSFVALQNCKILHLENNNISSLKKFPILELQELNLQGNIRISEDDIDRLKSRIDCNILY